VHVTVPLAFECEEVLLRHRQVAGRSRRETLAFLGLVVRKAQRHKVDYLWRGHAEDPEDAHVVEAAVASGTSRLVTFNTEEGLEPEELMGNLLDRAADKEPKPADERPARAQ